MSNDYKQHTVIVELVSFILYTASLSMSTLSGGDMSVFIGHCNVMMNAMLYFSVYIQESF